MPSAPPANRSFLRAWPGLAWLLAGALAWAVAGPVQAQTTTQPWLTSF